VLHEMRIRCSHGADLGVMRSTTIQRRFAGPALALLAWLSGSPALADAAGQILYHEPVRLLPPTMGTNADETATVRLVFDALGQRFEFTLEPNERLQRRRTLRGFELLQGQIEGLPDSWVRLTRRGRQLLGMFFDGQELYTIEPWSEVAGQSVGGGDNDGQINVVYRLRDVLMPAGAASCGPTVPSAQVRGDVAFAELAEELGSLPALEAQGANRRIQLRAVADYEFFQRWGADSESQILSRMNIVDGIFSDQLGLQIDVATIEVFDTAADPFSTSVPSDLLDEVADYRQSRATGEGLTHLFTWRDLDGTTRGIAYLGSACMFRFGVALSQQLASSLTTGALITAHEIGHNFNAQHDGEPSDDPTFPNPCESVPQTFLMAPTIGSNSDFSQCSLDVISSFIDTLPNSCVTTLGPQLANVPTTLTTRTDTNIALNFTVVNNSGNTSTGVVVSLDHPAELDVLPQNVSCNVATGSTTCNLGDLANGAQQTLSFTAGSGTVGNYAVIIAVAADLTPDSDRSTVTVNVQASPVAQAGGGGGGGGGALTPWGLGWLLALGLGLRRRS
jgi:hypothetical protein